MKIIVREEKHSVQYYDASTQEKMHAAALLILAERMDPDYAFIVPPDEPRSLPEDVLMPAQIAALPTEKMRADAALARKRHERRRFDYDIDLAEWRAAVAAVRVGDGAAAFKILQLRKANEYEGFQLVDVLVAGPPPPTLVTKIKRITPRL